MTIVHCRVNFLLHTWPLHVHPCQALHPSHPRTTFMQLCQHPLLSWWGNYDPRSPQYTAILHRYTASPPLDNYSLTWLDPQVLATPIGWTAQLAVIGDLSWSICGSWSIFGHYRVCAKVLICSDRLHSCTKVISLQGLFITAYCTCLTCVLAMTAHWWPASMALEKDLWMFTKPFIVNHRRLRTKQVALCDWMICSEELVDLSTYTPDTTSSTMSSSATAFYQQQQITLQLPLRVEQFSLISQVVRQKQGYGVQEIRQYKKCHPHIASDLRDGKCPQSVSSDIFSIGRVVHIIKLMFIRNESLEEPSQQSMIMHMILQYHMHNHPDLVHISECRLKI